MTIAKKMTAFGEKSSWIRKMFEEGTRLKNEFGADQVYDFSLGNPDLPPPEAFQKTLQEVAADESDGRHAYMANAGLMETRQAIADHLVKEQGVAISGDEILMTCGAAGALNVVLKTVLDPGDEVVTPAPFFVEYRFYADNHGGNLVTVPTHADFTLDLDALEKAIGPQTKVVIINSPNNPTGQVYDKSSLTALGELLTTKSKALGRTIYLVSDEPYRKIVYDQIEVPSIFSAYPETLVCTSYSKDLSIPGERLGFIAIHPDATYKADLLAGLNLANRILGFVNAPALMQRVAAKLQGEKVDVNRYQKRRDLLCNGLADAGYTFTTPPGAFYLFPQSPIEDDVAFVRALQEERILVVPGSGFGGPGHFRISYCVPEKTIADALPGFKKVLARF